MTTLELDVPAYTAPNGARPGVVFAHRWVWVDYPEPDPEADEDEGGWRPSPDYRGFRVQVLANPMGGEELDERQARIALLNGIRGKEPAITEDEYLQRVAWRVRAWNALSADDDGNVVPIPAPGEAPDNWRAFRAIPSDLMAWVCETVRTIHLPKSRTTTNLRPVGTTDAPAPPRDRPPAPETE